MSLKEGGSQISGTIQAVKDGTTATVFFTDTQLNTANGTYALYLTDVATNESQTGAILKFAPRSIMIADIVPHPAAPGVSVSKPLILTITGKNLDRLKSLTLTNAGATVISAKLDTPTSTSPPVDDNIAQTLTATFSAADLMSLKAGPASLKANSFVTTEFPDVPFKSYTLVVP